MIAALFVETDGVYFCDPRIEPWDIYKNARLYRGPHKVIAHPPCQRWGRYWSGGPMLAKTDRALLKGDDNNCFAHALWSVRTFGGVIEHPEASHAWPWFGLIKPPKKGGWVKADDFGGYTCCVEQGHYGHTARKATWLYSVDCALPDLIWGPSQGLRLDEGFHSKKERKEARESGAKPKKRLSRKQQLETPKAFKELLISLVL